MSYIEREAVNALIKAECSPKVAAYLIDAVAAIPAADVRPVVLCKDCRHRDPEDPARLRRDGAERMTNAEAIEILKSRRMCAAYVDSEYVDSVDIEAIDMAISALEKQEGKKKANIKRLPCACGRKQLDQWWSGEEGNEGWFYKCPVCGLQSRIVKKKCQLNEAWNEIVRSDEYGAD